MPEVILKNIIILLIAAGALALLTSSCDNVDENRIPYAEVHLTFHTVGDWNLYGVKSDAAGFAYYIHTPQHKEPVNFPYTLLDRTGYGGLLLVTDVLGDLKCYDMACPVEIRPNVTVEIPRQADGTFATYAECPKCGSRYDVFLNNGYAMSGPAAQKKKRYKLQSYSVVHGGATEYLVITR